MILTDWAEPGCSVQQGGELYVQRVTGRLKLDVSLGREVAVKASVKRVRDRIFGNLLPRKMWEPTKVHQHRDEEHFQRQSRHTVKG